jgi:hypothetical protein
MGASRCEAAKKAAVPMRANRADEAVLISGCFSERYDPVASQVICLQDFEAGDQIWFSKNECLFALRYSGAATFGNP